MQPGLSIEKQNKAKTMGMKGLITGIFFKNCIS